MFFNKRYNHKNIIMFFFFAQIIFFIVSPIILTFLILPNEIRLIAGKEENFQFNIPVFATIEPEKNGVLKINSETINEKIDIDLSDNFSIYSEEEGSVDVSLSLFGTVPIKKMTVDIMPSTLVVPCGMTVGVKINTEGIMVLGTGFVKNEEGKSEEPSKGLLRAGDLILIVNGNSIENKEQLTKYVEDSEGKPLVLTIKRNDGIIETNVTPVFCSDDEKYKIGCWVRDSTQGIGTITYYNPDTMKYGALGHGIMDVDTKQLMSIKDGNVMESSVTSVRKGKKGSPGELIGSIANNNVIGNIRANSIYGIYGYLHEGVETVPTEQMAIGLQSQVREGEAYVLSNVEGRQIKKYSVEILSVNKFSNDDSKGMIIKITDEDLLGKTSGIVQGMSGSPIIQDGKLIGAVTHVFVQDPTKGYGIFIENMINQEKNF